mgnify:CR=1 FL=1
MSRSLQVKVGHLSVINRSQYFLNIVGHFHHIVHNPEHSLTFLSSVQDGELDGGHLPADFGFYVELEEVVGVGVARYHPDIVVGASHGKVVSEAGC